MISAFLQMTPMPVTRQGKHQRPALSLAIAQHAHFFSSSKRASGFWSLDISIVDI